MDRILCDSTALPAWPAPRLGVGGLPRWHCWRLESGFYTDVQQQHRLLHGEERRTLELGISKAISGRGGTRNVSGSGGLWIINIYEMTPGALGSTMLGRVALGCRLVSVADEGWAVIRTGLSSRWPGEDPRSHEGNKHKKKLAKLFFSFFWFDDIASLFGVWAGLRGPEQPKSINIT